jgi:hypothetical protein
VVGNYALNLHQLARKYPNPSVQPIVDQAQIETDSLGPELLYSRGFVVVAHARYGPDHLGDPDELYVALEGTPVPRFNQNGYARVASEIYESLSLRL